MITVILSWTCSKSDGVGPNSEKEINVFLKHTEDYEYQTGIGGDEEGAIIKKQAQNHEISEIIRNRSTNWEAVYKYKPKANFVGFDYVEIETHKGSDGASPPTKIDVIKINFTLTN